MTAGEVRLDAGTTKNGEGRVFPFTRDLRRVLEDQATVAETLKHDGTPARYVFCYTRVTAGPTSRTWASDSWPMTR